MPAGRTENSPQPQSSELTTRNAGTSEASQAASDVKSSVSDTATLESMKPTPRTMPGVLELLPNEQSAFQAMIDTVRRVYELHGFAAIETPALEFTDLLLTKTGGETERQVYFAQSTGSFEQGKSPELALRFDLTVPLARYVAEHQHDLVFPFRRYQIQRVYRGEAAQRGRFREFYQADIDIVGRDQLPVTADAECPAVIADVFSELGIGTFTIRINNRKLIQGFLSGKGISADRHAEVLREIDKLEKRGLEAVTKTLVEMGLEGDHVAGLLGFVSYRSAGLNAGLEYLVNMETSSDTMATGRGELIDVFSTLVDLGVDDSVVALDCSIARGLDYYTGTVFETSLDDYPEVGSVCSGGRYDDLAGLYTSSKLPGVGLSIGLTRLFWQLREIGLIDSKSHPTLVYVTIMDDESVPGARRLVTSLRQAGVPTQMAAGPGRLGKQLKYVDKTGIRFAVIAGSEERTRNVVLVKDMLTQDQTEVSVDDLPQDLKDRGI